MPVWTVHAPPSPGMSAEPTDDLIFIREGFSWAALVFAPLWAVAHRLWLAFGIWLVAMILINLASVKVGEAIGWPLSIGFLVWFALEARDFQRAKLARGQWRLVSIVDAPTEELAEQRYFETLADERDDRVPVLPALPVTIARPQPGSFPPVVGYVSGERP